MQRISRSQNREYVAYLIHSSLLSQDIILGFLAPDFVVSRAVEFVIHVIPDNFRHVSFDVGDIMPKVFREHGEDRLLKHDPSRHFRQIHQECVSTLNSTTLFQIRTYLARVLISCQSNMKSMLSDVRNTPYAIYSILITYQIILIQITCTLIDFYICICKNY